MELINIAAIIESGHIIRDGYGGNYQYAYAHLNQAEQVRALWAHAREHGIKATQKQCLAAIKNLATLREGRASLKTEPAALRTRLMQRLQAICSQQIRERGLDTPTGWWSEGEGGTVTDYDPKRRLWVVSAEYRYHYSNRAGDWWVGASYLCGHDDGQYFAMRLPKGITKIDEALAWITPAEVRKAQEQGRWTARQGDVWLIGLKAGKDNVAGIRWTRHEWRSDSRTLEHPEHGMLSVPEGIKAVKAVRITQMASSGRRSGD